MIKKWKKRMLFAFNRPERQKVTLESVKFRKNGKLHNVEFPAEIHYGSKGQVINIIYRNKGKEHRIGGPASLLYYTNGNIAAEEYYVNGKRHRDPDEGPAFIKYSPEGKITCTFYFVQDRSIR